MFWARGHAVIQHLYGGLFILHSGFIYYLSHTSAVVSLPHCLSLSDGHDIVIRHLVFILPVPTQSSSSPCWIPPPPPHTMPKLLLFLPSGSSLVSSNCIRWQSG